MSSSVNLAFTLKQAKAVQKHFHYLIGNNFYNDDNKQITVECVTVAPFDDVNKWIYLQNYKEFGCSSKALSYYCAPFYDVLVIGPLLEDHLINLFTDIRSYLKSHGIPFDINQYMNN